MSDPYLAPPWREHPSYWLPSFCDQCNGHRSECAYCGERGDGRDDDRPYLADDEHFLLSLPEADVNGLHQKEQPIRFTIRWDVNMGCYRVSVPSLEGPMQVVPAEAYDRERAAYEAEFRHGQDLQDEVERLRGALGRIYQQGVGPHVEIAREALNV